HPPSATLTPPAAAYKELPKQAQDSGDWKVAQPQDAKLRGKCWEIYNDPDLNSLEEQLNINNQNIRQFFENSMQARTLVAQARSQLYPTIGFGPSFQRSRTSATIGSNNPSSTVAGRQTSTYTLPLDASWQPDL